MSGGVSAPRRGAAARGLVLGAACAGGLLGAVDARAQEAMYTHAATMPAPGTIVLREQFHWYEYGTNPASGVDETTRLEAMTSIAYGVDRGWAVYLDVPLTHTEERDAAGDESSFGVDDLSVWAKWRVYQRDTGGINTVRAAVFGGVEFAFEDTFQAHPFVGGVVTMVRGRHGFNQDLIYHLNTDGSAADNYGGEGPDDALLFNSAYLYRIFPTRFTADSRGAWYVTAEVNGIYETNGDVELRWSPGLMYEGRDFAFELMAQFPLWNELDERAELDFAVGVGVRFIF
ncbi:MAG: hypothetical protein SFY69_01940 [Planctomycetota bacterium]|nr:hypothetical protein [Planctomycetota bacterium]